MADLSGFLADAGLATGSAGGVKAKSEHGAKKDQADLVNEQGEDFEQLVAGADKVRSDGAKGADAEGEGGSGKSLPSMRTPGAAWNWPEPEAKGRTAIEGGKASEKAPAIRDNASIEQLVEGRRLEAGGSPGSQQRELFTSAREVLNSTQAQRSVPGPGAATGNLPPETAVQSGLTGQGGRTAPQSTGIVMQPGMVEPATAQLAAVLARGSEAGKGAPGARGTAEAPRIQVSLAETHFSPVKPDSELEAYDLARRMGGGRAEDLGRSLGDGWRQQGGVRSERQGRPAALQRDVRAEQLTQNGPRVPVAGDVSTQIGTRILQELEPSRPTGETRAAGPVHVKQSDPVLKVLEIRLEPRELGTVLVRMSLRDNVLQVELGFGKTDAAATIAKNTDQLTQYLRSSGYVVDDIVVRVVDADRAPAPVIATNQGPDAGQGSGGTSTSSAYSSASEQAFDEGTDQNPSGREGRSQDEPSREGSHGQDNTLPHSDSGLFV